MLSDTPKTADPSRKIRRRRISSVHSSSIYEEATLSYPDPEIPKVEVATLVAAFENKSTLDLTDVIQVCQSQVGKGCYEGQEFMLSS